MYVVYVLTDNTSGAVKVGLAKNLKHRLCNYATHNPHGVTVVNHRGFGSKSAAARAESFILRRLKPHRISGEWHKPIALDAALELLLKAPDRESRGFHME